MSVWTFLFSTENFCRRLVVFGSNNIHEKIVHFDWLRAVQFLGNTVRGKKRNSLPRKNSVQISLDFKLLNFLKFKACVYFFTLSVC